MDRLCRYQYNEWFNHSSVQVNKCIIADPGYTIRFPGSYQARNFSSLRLHSLNLILSLCINLNGLVLASYLEVQYLISFPSANAQDMASKVVPSQWKYTGFFCKHIRSLTTGFARLAPFAHVGNALINRSSVV